MDIESKIKKEKELFEQWKRKNDKIVPDGVVCWEEYAKSKCKILFILKEVNSDENDWDLRDFLLDGDRSFTWNNIIRWIMGIRNLDLNYNWKDIEIISKIERKKYLKTIAAINLKKETGGTAVADNDNIYKCAIEDRELLKNQVDIYEPDLIICCGTANEFFDSVYKDIDVEWKMTHNGVRYVKNADRIIVSYNHPAARVSNILLYYPLIDALREIMD